MEVFLVLWGDDENVANFLHYRKGISNSIN